jgi:hypothetical protein
VDSRLGRDRADTLLAAAGCRAASAEMQGIQVQDQDHATREILLKKKSSLKDGPSLFSVTTTRHQWVEQRDLRKCQQKVNSRKYGWWKQILHVYLVLTA